MVGFLWGIPDSCKIGNTIFKKLFYDNGDFNTSDKELFKSAIDKITWFYCLKPETINVKAYKDEIRDYPEIEVLEVTLQTESKLKRIAEIIMRTIPYPMILIFTLDNKKQIWTAHQRTNQNDSTKNTIEKFINTDWIDEDNNLLNKLNISNMNMTDFFSLYSGFVDTISIHNASAITDKEINGEQARELITKIEELDSQISNLKSRVKKETQFNKKVELTLEMKKLEQKKKEIVEG